MHLEAMRPVGIELVHECLSPENFRRRSSRGISDAGRFAATSDGIAASFETGGPRPLIGAHARLLLLRSCLLLLLRLRAAFP